MDEYEPDRVKKALWKGREVKASSADSHCSMHVELIIFSILKILPTGASRWVSSSGEDVDEKGF